jgi:hypothetical protein
MQARWAHIACAAALLVVIAPKRASTQVQNKWSLDATPYLWALGIKGRTGLQDKTAHVDISFRELLDHLKGFAIVSFEGHYARWALGLDVNYLKVQDTFAAPDPPFTDATHRARQSMVEIGSRYRVLNAQRVRLDLVAGGRWWSLGNKLTLSSGAQPGTELELNKDWVDPFVGARSFIDLSPRVLLEVYGDVGGFGASSKFSWQAIGAIGYKVGSRWMLRGGYRQVDVNYNRG